MVLEYIREYRTYFHISQSYGVSESSAYKTVKWVEDTLIKHEEGIKTVYNNKNPKKNKLTILDFNGIISDKEAHDMNKIIKETCENINPDDWK